MWLYRRLFSWDFMGYLVIKWRSFKEVKCSTSTLSNNTIHSRTCSTNFVPSYTHICYTRKLPRSYPEHQPLPNYSENTEDKIESQRGIGRRRKFWFDDMKEYKGITNTKNFPGGKHQKSLVPWWPTLGKRIEALKF